MEVLHSSRQGAGRIHKVPGAGTVSVVFQVERNLTS